MNQLTSAQKNIWNLQKFYENTTISTICGAIVYEKIISSEMLQRALNLFIQEQESLRLQFRIVNGEPYQYVVPYEEELFPVVSFSTEQEYLEFVNIEKSRKFTLVDEKMYRFFICQFFDHTALLLLVNHLIMDAWSVGILGSRVAELVCMYETAGKEYEIAISGKDEMKENQKAYQPQICSYMEHVEREKVYKESGYYQKDQEYWRELYAVKPQIAYIKSEREANTGVNAKRFDVFMEKDFSKEILKFCRVEQITPALLFETALCIYLGKLNLENRAVSIGMMALNRIGNKEKKMAGMFVSTIPFSVSYEEQMTVREMFDLVMKSQGGSFRHQQYPYEEIQRYLKDRHQMSGNLYDVLFSYQNIRIESKLPFYTEWYSNGYSEVALALHVDDRDGNGMFHITMDYQTDIFPHEEEIKLLYKRMICIMRQMMEFPEEKLERISIIPRKEYYRLVEVFNDTHMDYNKDMCVHELFSNQARRTPERIALVFRQNQYTYRQIDEMSNTLAHVLCDTGLDKGSIVPVVAVRGWQVVVAMFGIIKAGGAYLLVDAKYPEDRILYLLKESGAGICLTFGWSFGKGILEQGFQREETDFKGQKKDAQNLYGNWKVIALEQIEPEQSEGCIFVSAHGKSEDVFCAQHTSGTTGRPKILLLSHGNVLHFTHVLKSIQDEVEEVLSGTQIGFDAFSQETVMSLANGKKVWMLSEQEMTKQTEFEKFVGRCRWAFMFQTPSKLMGYIKNAKDRGFLRHVGVWLLGGEVFPKELFMEIKKWSPESTVINGYGPSETTQGCLYKVIEDENNITIGSPVSHMQIYILDKKQSLVPIGVPGEICIAGDGVGLGYLKQSELTAEKFVSNPFSNVENGHGKVMYKSGDFARWNSDGEVEFLGRIDTQVKIRGLRIELGEIESVMLQFPGIFMSAVAAKKDVRGRQYLIGYYCTDEKKQDNSFWAEDGEHDKKKMDDRYSSPPEGKLDERKLREHLLSKLPGYMVPNFFVYLEHMPLLPSGKLNRNSLPDLEQLQLETNLDLRKFYVAPENEIQKKLCRLVDEVLHIGQVGLDDDFFELGGDSLTALELVAKAENAGISLELQSIFNYPTVRQMEKHIFLQNERESIDTTHQKRKINDISKEAGYGMLNLNPISWDAELVYHSLGTVLLTGATGFLGMHLLYRLLESETGRVYCLLRDKKSRDRFYERLEYYFGTDYRWNMEQRILFVYGELSEPSLVESLKSQLMEPVLTVIHAAAIVKHYGKEEVFHRVNVEGTRQMLEFADMEKAVFIHISTTSVSGMQIERGKSSETVAFDETCLYIGQKLDNVYIRSKYEAELCVLEAINRGQRAKVCRVGNLTSRYVDGRFQKNASENAFLNRMRAFLELKAYPKILEFQQIEFSPVDETAEAVILLAQYTSETDYKVFHVNHTNPPVMEELAAIYRKCGNELEAVDTEEFLEHLYQIPGKEYDAVKNEFREYFRQKRKQQGTELKKQSIQIRNRFTGKILKRLGFRWKKIDMSYIRNYVEYM